MSRGEVGKETVSYDVPSDEAASHAVVRAVSALEDRKPTDLDEPLHTAVDVEALNSLFERQSDGALRFRYAGFTVVVDFTGTVVVTADETE
ncbi:HalOD1 output domain-containing protein [Natrarchaeobius chitinivorans]|uniref:Halobacterial output domain-containing protein n=1 Tax=Natrarchaeobius chitinivorans TaxID=1679083 RepID=A0A3N6PHX3_NATCH|nr:HalOD1 output domain-containing protein [Natrarchaeobius chitinivorans]RQG97765.1 hypothetical protein EA473_00685 [Natrarchaeobius chitinivorans]